MKLQMILVLLEMRPCNSLTINLSSFKINQIQLPIEPNIHSVNSQQYLAIVDTDQRLIYIENPENNFLGFSPNEPY